MKIIFLGTGSIPTESRNSHGILIEDGGGTLIDCGEGIQRQLMKYHYDVTKLHTICITHGHVDHILGLVGLVCLIGKKGGKVTIVGSEGVIHQVKDLLKVYGAPFMACADLHVIRANERFQRITAFDTFHCPESLGFVYESKEKKLVFGGDMGMSEPEACNLMANYFEGADMAVMDGVHITTQDCARLMHEAGLKRAYLVPIPNDVDPLTFVGKGVEDSVSYMVPEDFDEVILGEEDV